MNRISQPLLSLFLGLIVATCAALAHAEKLPKLILAGPMASVSNPLIHIVESGALADLAEQVEFVSWRDPDQLRVLALDGKADFIAMPTNVAANLYNRGRPLELLNVSTWGLLWMVSRDPSLKTLRDFKGKEIAMPFRADMPDIIFRVLAEHQGLDPRKDFRMRYVSNPVDAMQLLLMRRVDHVLLAEPAISMALRKSHSFPLSTIAPDIYRSVDLQKEWGRVFQREARIPQAGIVALGKAKDNSALIARFQAAYADALKWCEQHAEACGVEVARHIKMLTPEAVADSVRAGQNRFVTAEQARPELEFFFRLLLGKQPGLVGGKLPDAAFYYVDSTPVAKK